MTFPAPIEQIGDSLSLLLIPHERNNHHPHATRYTGIVVFLIGILISQVFTSLITGRGLTLAFATNIQKEELISLTNVERNAHGAGSLAESPALSQAALLKAQHMFANDYWAHVAPDGTTPWHFFELVGYKYVYAGENLARGFDTSGGVVNGWMNSPSHRENLLNPNYKEIGMAVLNGQLGGEPTTLVVQLFGSSTTAVASTPVVKSTPTPTPKPTVVAVASGAASQVVPITPAGIFPSLAPTPIVQVLTSFKPAESLNPNQQVLLLSLIILATIFVVDALVLARKRLLHLRPHAILHALVVLSLIGLVVISSKAVVL